jgi:hypothetical protein
LSKDSINVIDADMPIRHLGKVKKGESITTSFKITNVSDKEINFQTEEKECSCITLKYQKHTLKPGESTDIEVTLATSGLNGNTVQAIFLKTIESNLKEKIVITAEINP